MDQLLTPFTVTPTQISGLGAAFTPFVNALLRVEVASAGLSNGVITTTYLETVGDEGVDAGLSRAIGSRFIPAGDSAWQFKRGDLPPAKCRAEIIGATAALEVLRRGGKYRLVLGADVNNAQVRRRRDALREEAEKLGIRLADDSIEVLNASDLAEWAQSRPSLTVSQLLGGIRGAAEDFNEWASSRGAATLWVDSPERQGVIDAVRQVVGAGGRAALHIEGVSGLGKSRTVLEALRGQPYEALVIYVRVADTLPTSLIRYLTGEGRTAVLVVDDCEPTQHKNLEAAIPPDSSLKLITIGEPGPSRTEDGHVELPPVNETTMAEILKINRPNLWQEASQFVTEVAAGNVRLGLVLAGAVEREPRSSAATLITKDIIETYVTQALPAGISFLACCALALFTRIGYEGELAGELQLLSEVVGVSETELRAGARALAELGLLTSNGRFRSVTPQPLAVYLARTGWDEYGALIAERLLPAASTSLTERLLQRAAEVGRSTAVQRAVDAVMGKTEIFGSLSAIGESGYSRALIQLGILAPVKVTSTLSELIAAATDDELRADRSFRQNLVWTLEKLAWHSNTFEQAATALLRLAVTETENYSNNAAGTWCSLFGVMLPSTAALPAVRIAYLSIVGASEDVRERALAVKGAATALQPHQSVIISAERQHGVVVEPRGVPATYGELWDYQRAAIQLLRQLADDVDQKVAAAALDALVSAIHPLLEHQAIRGDLFEALNSLPENGLRRVRTEAAHLRGLFERAPNLEGGQAGLDQLMAALPAATEVEQLRSLVQGRRWDFKDGELQDRITDTVRTVHAESGSDPLFALFDDELQAAFELGRALAEVAPGEAALSKLTTTATSRNSPALAGYLWGLVQAGDAAAFDNYLDHGLGNGFDPATKLGLTVQGPQSDAGWQRVEQLVHQLPVGQATRGLFGWHVGIEAQRLTTFLSDWLEKIETQLDYNATVDFMGMALFRRPPWVDELDDMVAQLVRLRAQFPDTGQESWDWIQLAKRQVERQPVELLHVIVELIEAGALHVFGQDEERDLVIASFREPGPEGWGIASQMLEARSWHVQMDVRGWLVEQFEPDVVTAWIGNDLKRAQLVAGVAAIGGDEPTPVARYLLDHFGSDSQVSGPLAGQFWSGSWWGNQSDRLAGQIAQLQNWALSATEPEGVKHWAREVIQSLEKNRERALREEAEEDFS